MQPFDVVALTADLPELKLVRGQVGTVVDTHTPEVVEVEFSDDQGQTYALGAIEKQNLMVLYHHPVKVG